MNGSVAVIHYNILPEYILRYDLSFTLIIHKNRNRWQTYKRNREYLTETKGKERLII